MRLTTAACSDVYSLFLSVASDALVAEPFALPFAFDVESVRLCLVPDDDGCVSADVENPAPSPAEVDADDEEEAEYSDPSSFSTISRSLVPSGVENKLRDF